MISCRDYALKLISIRDRTEKEMRTKLSEKKYLSEDIENQIEFLKEYGYINDRSYAERFISDAVNLKKWGIYRIKNELLHRGISSDVVENLIDESGNDSKLIIKSEMKRRFSDADFSNPKERNRIFAYFARRGFASDEIRSCMNKLCSVEFISDDE